MKQDCIDIGLIQAFMDGELDHGQVDRVSGHIAACDTCALLLADAEDESAVVFPALEREFNTLVPSQRLWTKINDSIATERGSRPFWQKAWEFLSVGFLTPSMLAAASLLIVVGVTALVLTGRQPLADDSTKIAAVRPAIATTSAVPVISSNPDVIAPDVAVASTNAPTVRAERADYRPAVRRVYEAPVADFQPAVVKDTSNGYLPGEESYVRTIASLSRSVESQKDNTIRGSERMSFERDLAVVDDAITKMRVEVKKDPKNESAKQVLYSSYQNKIDLLSSVSQKEELVASLK
ncbi:MAG: zf-HC2 domain-containing protein [Acidobacteriota bacterium]